MRRRICAMDWRVPTVLLSFPFLGLFAYGQSNPIATSTESAPKPAAGAVARVKSKSAAKSDPIAVTPVFVWTKGDAQPIATSKTTPPISEIPKLPAGETKERAVAKRPKALQVGRTQFAIDRVPPDGKRTSATGSPVKTGYRRLPGPPGSAEAGTTWNRSRGGAKSGAPSPKRLTPVPAPQPTPGLEALKQKIRSVGGEWVRDVRIKPVSGGPTQIWVTVPSKVEEAWVVPNLLQIPEMHSSSVSLHIQLQR